ncbi:MAG: carboxypeptidase-like regulatory domain-containing protein, partial [Planctomycetaceae bacterium]
RNMIPLSRFRSWTSVGALLLAGCIGAGEGGEQVDVYEVTGKVTMAGGPVANASVIFSPKEKQPVAMGRTNASGEFTLTTYEEGDGAAVGEYEVLISKQSVKKNASIPQHDPNNPNAFTPPSHSGAQAAEAGSASGLPAKYGNAGQSGIMQTVKADGDNNFAIELTP